MTSTIWNTAPTGVIDTNSAAVVSQLVSQVASGFGPFASESCACPQYEVTSATPRTTVRVEDSYGKGSTTTSWGIKLDNAFVNLGGARLPSVASPPACSDHPMTVYVTDTDEYIEMFQARWDSTLNQWWCVAGGITTQYSLEDSTFSASSYSPYSDDGWGVRASKFMIRPGVIRASQWSFGGINHALETSAINVNQDHWILPAHSSDGKLTGYPTDIMYGDKFYLPSSFQVRQSISDVNTQILAKAAKDWGIVIGDRAPLVAFAGAGQESPNLLKDTGTLAGLTQTQRTAILSNFPWSSLILQQRGTIGP